MNSGGITETIWHFAGYLHIADEVARASTLYSGEPQKLPSEDDANPLREPARELTFEETSSQPVFTREPSPPVTHLDAPHLVTLPHVPVTTKLVLSAPTLPHLELIEEPSFQRLVSVPSARVIAVEYQSGGSETLADLRQLNHAEDRDLVTSNAIRGSDGAPVIPAELHLDDVRDAMVAQAEAAGPAELQPASAASTETLVETFKARAEIWAETGSPNSDGTPAQTAPEGRIVDGVASDADLPVPSMLDIAPWRPDEPAKTEDPGETPAPPAPAAPTPAAETLDAPEPTDGVATIAETGLNTLINAALIVDLDEAVGSLMIGGDHFFSRGIVQVNILTDSDHVDIAVEGALTPTVVTQGNEVHNVAEFVTHVMTASVHGAAATPLWSIDVMPGDFYDIKSIRQINNLNDDDRTVQAESGTYFDLQTGGNQQVNLTEVRGIDSYDLIVVMGNYYRADWIYQYNIVLDPDSAKVLATGGADDETTVTTGFNQLINLATIETYDSAEFKELNHARRELMEAIGEGHTILIPHSDWNLYGPGGTLKVLYVPGDYYDVNVITQVNLLIDADQSIQASASGGTTQGIAAGGNTAINEARIIDPGTLSTSKYLGGDAYEESVLIQVNMITDTDTVTIHDTQTLVSELVAFAQQTEHDRGPPHDLPLPVDPAQHDHLMSNMLS